MKLLADTNIFIKFCRRLPLPDLIRETLANEGTERCLSPVSIIELYRLWKAGNVPDNPDTWIDLALPSWTILPVTVAIARQSVLWNWDHRDPADRLLAATAAVENVEWRHTDRIVKKFSGFPHRYFPNKVAKH